MTLRLRGKHLITACNTALAIPTDAAGRFSVAVRLVAATAVVVSSLAPPLRAEFKSASTRSGSNLKWRTPSVTGSTSSRQSDAFAEPAPAAKRHKADPFVEQTPPKSYKADPFAEPAASKRAADNQSAATQARGEAGQR